MRPEARLARQPFEEGLQVAQRRMDRRLAQPLAGPGVDRLAQLPLESHGLFAVEAPEVRLPVECLEAGERLRHAVDRRLVAPARFRQVAEIVALDPLVCGIVFSPSLGRAFRGHNSGKARCAHLGLAGLP